MSYLETIKKQSPYSHLPNFAILSKNKLYLPNLSTSSKILGKWSLEWIDSDRYVLGFVEQDDHDNIYFQITSCYEFINNNQLQLIDKPDFTSYWSRVYTHEPLLTPIKFNISDFYTSNSIKLFIEQPTVAPAPVLEKTVAPAPAPVLEKKPTSEKKPLKEKVIDNYEFTVSKTEKPDVYYVYKGSNHISTCLIPNLKTSRYMQNLFEHKNIGERISMNLKLHESTKKYMPVIE